MNFNIFQRTSLKTKLTFFTLFVFLTGVWSIAWYATSLLRGEMEQQLGEQQFSTVSMLAGNINEGLEERLGSLELIAKAITPAMMANTANLQDFLDHRQVFLKLFNNGVFVTRIDGTVISDVPSSTGRLGVNYIDRDFVIAALKEDKSSVGTPVMGKVLKKPVFGMATPIRDAQGKIIGVLAGTIDLGKRNFLDKVTGSKVGKTGGYLVVAPQQRLGITGTDQYFTMKPMPAPGINPLLDRYLAGFEGFGSVIDSRGVGIFSAAKGIPVSGWVLVGRIPTDEAFAPVANMQRRVLLATLLFTLAAGCLIWLMTWRLLKHQLLPMIAATKIIHSLSDPSKPLQSLPVRSQDEIGQLITGFNRLLEIMREREATKEEALNLLQKIASRIPGVVFQFRLRPDGSSCIPYASEALQDIYRVRPDAVRDDASMVFAVVHPDDLQQHLASITASAKDLSPWQNEYRLKFGDETPFWLMGSALPQSEPDGSILWHGFIADITERKHSEMELDQYRLHLEELVEERTSALSVAKEAAEAASRAKSTFLANMSHELRTPMNGIMGMVSIALRHATDPKLRHQLQTIDHSSQHLLGVINDILDISKIEAGRMSLEQVDFTFGDVLENLRDLFKDKVAEKHLVLNFDVPMELQTLALLGDPLRLGQIFLNLASNAIKFTEQGSVTVFVRISEQNKDHVVLSCEVRDTGIGIGAAEQKRLFAAFVQADSSMTRKYGGTGLGLVISESLVQMMSGEISIESAPGQGSTFRFNVRLRKGTPSKSSNAGRELSAEVILQGHYAGTRVLLAEDEPINQEVSRELLEDVGFIVDVANDGKEALVMAKQKLYALILMDMQMPNLSGVDATKAIRLESVNTDTPILAMTANAFEEDRQICLAAGMNDHIGKPVDPGALFSKLLAWLERSH